MKKRALISVSKKDGIVEFAKQLIDLDFEIVSSGGTAKTLEIAGLKVIKVSDVTKFPEMMNGRVKTLHPNIHGGILADRSKESHLQEAKENGITLIDLVCVNLYPFAEKLAEGADEATMIENIDIGGPSMIRSAAKNHKDVVIITDVKDYNPIINEYKSHGEISLKTRKMLAYKAFSHTAEYDVLISDYFSTLVDETSEEEEGIVLELPLKQKLRYGENPHLAAEYYEMKGDEIINILHGKELSYNNYLDIDAALKTIIKFEEPTCAIFKHTNPCGIASAENLTIAYKNAFATDTLSPFGGIVIVNKPLDMETALEINKVFTEIIIAPEYEEGVLERLMKKKNRRLLTFDMEKVFDIAEGSAIVSCMNGLLVQDFDINTDDETQWKSVTERKPSEEEMKDLIFAWKSVSMLKSNAVAFAKDSRTLGLGIGQTSRIDSTEIAVSKAKKFGLSLENAVCASDGFFPFADSIETIKDLGIKAIIQPGGSKGDQEVIEACNKYGIAMVFTGMRHFRH